MELKLQTISQVSKGFGVSTRMLRYYEQTGLISSTRLPDYAYRVYDREALDRLRQILLLRKLRIPVKQIQRILSSSDAVTAIEVFRRNVGELDEEIAALSTIRSILNGFIEELQAKAEIKLNSLLVQDASVLSAIDSLTQISINFKEEKTMEELSRANESLSKLTDVRIIHLPPSAVASSHHVGDDPELHANNALDRFVRESKLSERKPDLRHYGFNHPNPKDETGYHGYEAWVTIPDDLEVPPPLVKKTFPGGLYAAHMVQFGNFGDWDKLLAWANEGEEYEFAGDMADQEHMCGLLEEHLNYYSHIYLENSEPENMQLDLLMPIRERKR